MQYDGSEIYTTCARHQSAGIYFPSNQHIGLKELSDKNKVCFLKLMYGTQVLKLTLDLQVRGQ